MTDIDVATRVYPIFYKFRDIVMFPNQQLEYGGVDEEELDNGSNVSGMARLRDSEEDQIEGLSDAELSSSDGSRSSSALDILSRDSTSSFGSSDHIN